MTDPHKIYTLATSFADELGYQGQKAVAEAAEGNDYRIVGGHMVRLLLHVYPTANAIPRSTTDADAAIGSLEIAAPMAQNFLAQNFTKEGGNVFYRDIAPEQRVEINLLAPRTGPALGIRPKTVPGVGQIDTLPELNYIFLYAPLIVDVEVDLVHGGKLSYQTRIPGLEEALVLKAFAGKGRNEGKDLADLHTLLEIRETHPEAPWRLNRANLGGFRGDTVRILQPLVKELSKKRTPFPVPDTVDKRRFAALISKHCGQGEGSQAKQAPVAGGAAKHLGGHTTTSPACSGSAGTFSSIRVPPFLRAVRHTSPASFARPENSRGDGLLDRPFDLTCQPKGCRVLPASALVVYLKKYGLNVQMTHATRISSIIQQGGKMRANKVAECWVAAQWQPPICSTNLKLGSRWGDKD